MVQMPCQQVIVVGAVGAVRVAVVTVEQVKRRTSKTHRAVAITQAPTKHKLMLKQKRVGKE
jgi:hypothetical protein